MNIGIFDPYLNDVGGGEKYMMSIASVLSKEHTVTVFWDEKKDLEQIRLRFGLDLSKVRLAKNIFSSDVSTWRRLLVTSTFDAIIFLSDGSIPLVASRKLFIHVQQPLPAFGIDSFIGRLKVERITKVFCNSEFTKSYIEGLLPAPMTVLYPEVIIKRKDETKKNIILHVGRFRGMDPLTKCDDFKKQSFMLSVWKEMVKKGVDDWEFILAASVKDEDVEVFEQMKKTAKDLPITFAVNRTNEQLWDLYNKAKIYWHASGYGEDLKKNPEKAEHFGISTVEAMGAGAVPVVINAGGQKEIVTDGENGLLWNTREEFIAQTRKLMTNNTSLKKLSENAKLRAKDFDKEKFEIGLREIIR